LHVISSLEGSRGGRKGQNSRGVRNVGKRRTVETIAGRKGVQKAERVEKGLR
jgi:hypothetical protein